MIKNARIIRLSDEYVFKPFDCGNKDLNDFLFDDAKAYRKRLLAVTYIVETDSDVVAYFSLSNDKISIPDSDKSTWRKIKKLFPHAKHRSDYPAVKIGRLAVNRKFQGENIGSDILKFVCHMFVSNNRTGCTFVTVDALCAAVPFYLRNGFNYLDKSIMDKPNADTCPLYFDLSQLI